MTATEKNAPAAGGNQREGENQNTNHQEGEPIMTESTSATTETEVRYVVVGTDIRDTHEGRIARFQNAGVAQIGADWLNGPDATPDDYEWVREMTIGASLRLADKIRPLLRAEGWDLSLPEIALGLAKATSISPEVSK